MIAFSAQLLASGGSREGIAPANLLDVQDTNGNLYFWADRAMSAPQVIGGTAEVQYEPWLLSAGPFTYHRSGVSDAGSFRVQNISGNTLARDIETTLRATTFEGAVFAYRCWQAGAEDSWIYAVGRLMFDDSDDYSATFKTRPLSDPAQEDTPLEIYCETCQLNWGLARCGSTQPTECQYSFQSCQVLERPMIALNSYEKNWGETTSNLPLVVINRSRRV